MSTETAQGIDVLGFDRASGIRLLLPQGHVVHGFSDSANARNIRITGSPRYSDSDPMLGYGVDSTAERALGRALISYALRERDGLPCIATRQYPVSIGERRGGASISRFDQIVWEADARIYQDDRGVVAASSCGGGDFGLQRLEVVSSGVVSAVQLLADSYRFVSINRERMARLPAIVIPS